MGVVFILEGVFGLCEDFSRKSRNRLMGYIPDIHGGSS